MDPVLVFWGGLLFVGLVVLAALVGNLAARAFLDASRDASALRRLQRRPDDDPTRHAASPRR